MPRVVPSQVVQVIEEYFPSLKTTTNMRFEIDRNHVNACASIAKLLDQIPPELLNPPIPDDYVKLVSNIAVLDFTLKSWIIRSESKGVILSGKADPNPISIIHDMLVTCPDEAISSKTAGLEFIDDLDLRNSLRLDLSSVNSALSNNEWKAATVLAGSVTEALLLWAINKVLPAREVEVEKSKEENRIKESDYNKWGLDCYNKVVKDLNIIKERTYKQVDLGREFRNYIHPGLEVRKKVKCNKATAHSGIAAVEFVIEDLSEYFSK